MPPIDEIKRKKVRAKNKYILTIIEVDEPAYLRTIVDLGQYPTRCRHQ
jgi:hypothetical protein